MRPNWHILPRAVLASLAVMALAACVPAEVFEEEFWHGTQETKVVEDAVTDAGLAALVKGDLATADRRLGEALAANPSNAYALAGAAILAERAGNDRRARQLYSVLDALRPPPGGTIAIPGEPVSGPLAEVARFKIARRAPDTGSGPATAGEADVSPVSRRRAADGNVIARFAILDRLLADSLITPTEHHARRSTNLGALLPLTQKPPSLGLNRPVPEADDVVGRMRAIGRAMAMGAMDPVQHAQERKLILDALLPARARLAASSATMPRSHDEVERALLRLEAAKDADVINASEYAAERQAIESTREKSAGGASSKPASAPNAAPASAGASHDNASGRRGKATTPVKAGPDSASYAIHLASYRRRDEASRGWAQLVRTYPRLLTGLRPVVSPFDLGAEKGRFFRLAAGPLTRAGAAAACTSLGARHQYCQPVSF